MRQDSYTLRSFLMSSLCLLLLVWTPRLACASQGNASDLRSNLVVILGLILLLGFAGGKIIQIIKMPAVTGYVLAGILLGVSALNIIPQSMIHTLRFIEVLGLSLVALIIGGDLQWKKLKDLGKSVFVITAVQVTGAFATVSIITGGVLHLPWSIAFILGAISSATAPAATVAVIHEYRARGPLTDTLMAIVALDDALCIILFSVVMGGVSFMLGAEAVSFKHLLIPLWDIAGSCILGSILGIVTIAIMRWVRDRHDLVIVVVGLAFLFGEIAEYFHMSALLTNMVFGFVLVNFSSNPRIFSYLVDIELPIFICFFTIAGAGLNLGVLFENWIPAIVFIVARGVGKVLGVYAGGVMVNAPKAIKKYLGFAMLPQAGVAIALVLAVQVEMPDIARLITALVLAAVAANEVIGPLGTKFALVKAGETNRPVDTEGAS